MKASVKRVDCCGSSWLNWMYSSLQIFSLSCWGTVAVMFTPAVMTGRGVGVYIWRISDMSDGLIKLPDVVGLAGVVVIGVWWFMAMAGGVVIGGVWWSIGIGASSITSAVCRELLGPWIDHSISWMSVIFSRRSLKSRRSAVVSSSRCLLEVGRGELLREALCVWRDVVLDSLRECLAEWLDLLRLFSSLRWRFP